MVEMKGANESGTTQGQDNTGHDNSTPALTIFLGLRRRARLEALEIGEEQSALSRHMNKLRAVRLSK
jgi:hypothetical protein